MTVLLLINVYTNYSCGLRHLTQHASSCASIVVNDKGIFQVIKIPNYNTLVLHHLYADNTLFVGEWSEFNIMNLACILFSFNISSGLKVNYSESKVFCIGANQAEVNSWANLLVCEPDSYVSITWYAWRLTLIKYVLGNLPKFYMPLFKALLDKKILILGSNYNKNILWVSWDKIVAAKEHVRLGVGSICVLKICIIVKWWRRLKMNLVLYGEKLFMAPTTLMENLIIISLKNL
uniref:Reverse transcriptase zinc-binding domain-containing protein n=1 Tax=Lactuca sativa TaxID=4236 RepID=A0A9R1WF43_LACSA|nr:hypothetical protein LSAT_V11C200054630 [Lactuca sativa]